MKRRTAGDLGLLKNRSPKQKPKANVKYPTIDLGRFFRVSHNRRAAFAPVNAIFPRHVASVVRQSEDGEREIVLMSWGFLRLEEGRAPKPVTNVRDDQLRTNPFWWDSFAKRPCLSCRRRPSASPMVM